MTARDPLAVLSSGLALILCFGAVVEGCAAQPSAPDPAGAAATVHVDDPTGQSPAQISWQAYPAPPPPGFHWQHTGSPAIQVDPRAARCRDSSPARGSSCAMATGCPR